MKASVLFQRPPFPPRVLLRGLGYMGLLALGGVLHSIPAWADDMVTVQFHKIDAASGDGYVLDFSGDQTLSVAVSDQAARQLSGGHVPADGQSVQLPMATAWKIMDGSLDAPTAIAQADSTVIGKDGEIVLSASGTGDRPPDKKTPVGNGEGNAAVATAPPLAAKPSAPSLNVEDRSMDTAERYAFSYDRL